MNADGTGIHQISFNQSHDLYGRPCCRTAACCSRRWDRAPGRDGMHLYTANPDGTDLQLHYGAKSHLTGTAVDRRNHADRIHARARDAATAASWC